MVTIGKHQKLAEGIACTVAVILSLDILTMHDRNFDVIINEVKMKIDLLNYRFSFSLNKTEIRQGACSQKYDSEDEHCLLVDCDNITFKQFSYRMRKIQTKYILPDVFILQSSENSFHAYCFCSRTFREIIHILTDIPAIDMMYVKLGIIRGYYTLRFSDRNNDKMQLVKILKSPYPDEMQPCDITINEYKTTNLGSK